MKPTRCIPLALLAICAACSATAEGTSPEGERPLALPDPAQPPIPPAPGAFEKVGILAPSSFTAVSIWPEQYAGALLVLEALQHGSSVAEGDVLAKLDTRAVDEEIHKAELEAQSAAIRHQSVVEKNRLDQEAAESQLELAKASLDRAQRSLEGWKKDELAFIEREDEISKRYEEANVEDQTDELDQLEKMYQADALVDATEDIVIKRSRRQLDLTQTSNRLARDRSQYRRQLDLALQTEQREEQVRKQAEELARLTRQQEIDARVRADAELRSADSVREQDEKLARLRRDRERLVLRAPRAGILLHGASKDYRPGRSPARVDRGSQLAVHQELFLIADPEPSAVALDVSDADLARLHSGTSVRVQTLGPIQASVTGTTQVALYPSSSSANEATYPADVTLEHGIAGAAYGSRAKIVVEASEKAVE